MQPHVKRHVRPVGERLLADDARERLLARVNPKVLFQQHLPGEGFVAVLADVRFLPGVYPDVHVVGDPLVEALAAVFASVLLAIAVDLHVRTQVSAIVEVLAALRAGRRELSCPLVHRPVVLVVTQLTELFAAL